MKKLIAVLLIAATLILGASSTNLLACGPDTNDDADDLPDIYFVR